MPVTPSNAADFEIGVVGDDVRRDGRFVAAELQLRREDAIAEAEARELVEASCGYTCDIVEGSGEYEGERYDQRQTNIQYNHVGLGPRGWGRAGADVKLRLDSGDAILVSQSDDQSPHTPPASVARKDSTMAIRLDGVDYEAPEQTVQAVNKELQRRADALTAAEQAKAEASKRADEIEAERDQLKKRLDAIDAAEAKREQEALIAKAQPHLDGDQDLSDLTPREIHALVLGKLQPELTLDSASDDYVRATFDFATKAAANATERTDGRAHVGVLDVIRHDASDADKALSERAAKAFSALATMGSLPKQEN